ncbi:peptidoglycan-recognition protein LC-like isoform 3-T4 [Cochliomyia hominivorax]
MKKMHYNTQCNNLIQRDINNKIREKLIPSNTDGDRNDNSESSLTFEVNAKNRKIIKKHNGESNIGTYKGTSTSCTSSTDSGVNISDNDEIPPSPTSSYLHSFPSSTSSSSGTATLNLLNKHYQKTYQNSNRDNNKNNDYNNHTFNVNNDNEADDDDDDDDVDDDDDDINNSKDFDNKLKIEQRRKRQQQQQQNQQKFLNVQCDSNECNNTQYQPNQNIIESENEITHQRNLTTGTPTIIVTNKTNNKNTTEITLQHDEFFNRPQRSPSISSSLSLSSSNTNRYKHNPPPNMHHCNGSPVVSIRSINSSTIITSDSDSDTDFNGDIEGVHDDYVIKKLGTQVSYPPNHPNIPNFNSGQTILNQKIVPGDDQVLTSPLALLAAVGDNIGAAQSLGPVPSFSAVPQRPQIGSIALSNSSDVTFGDKHFYEGPVTIQQFLIDSRDKSKDTNENDNPTFVNDENTNDAKDINLSPVQSGKRKKLIILGGLSTIVALLIVAAVLGSMAWNDSKNLYDDSECSGNGSLCLIDRDVWRAHPQKSQLDKQNLPLHRVIIAHTATDSCNSLKTCIERVRIIQEFHMNSFEWDDIGYNFLISSDGRVYVGRGWDAIGAHTKGYNKGSVGVAFIGTYVKAAPSDAQLKACLALLEEGVRLKKLVPQYHLYGARQFAATESPGDILYKIIKKWPHWSVDINLP